VITIIALILVGTVSLAFFNAKSEAYDGKTLADAKKIQEALKVYFEVNGYYPLSDNGRPGEIDQYLSFYPTNDNCPYSYERRSSDDYRIRYCLENGETSEVTGRGYTP
jgi:hypothetical protein